MIGSLLHNLANHGSKNAEPTPEELKRERINFHRERVRNGPANFGFLTNGQVRRQRERDALSQQRKQYKRAVKNHLEDRREESILRGQLQRAGILPGNLILTVEQRNRANAWLYSRFGEQALGAITPQHVEDALNAAWKRYTELTGLPYAPLERA